jgi:protein-S-isoprenylcysteine O-methyltransferase Ste14
MVGLVFTATMWAWGAAEVFLQVRQLRRSDRTDRSEWRSLLLFNVLAIGGFGLAGPITHAVPGLSYPLSAVALWVILFPTWLGIGLRLWSIVTLGQYFRGTVHVQEGHRVVTWGPYRMVRHPAYTGGLLAAAAASLAIENLAAWLVAMGCLAIAVGYRIRVEEAMLSDALGEPYTAYAARTSRLVPGIW